MIEMRNITKTWKGHKDTPVLKDISLKIEKGQSVGLMGRSGCGKSTLARILLFLERADKGEILYKGTSMTSVSQKNLKQYRKSVQYLSQHPESFLDPGWKLGKSIMEAGKVHHLPVLPMKDRLLELLELVKLNESILDRYPHQVSGGEIQRAALCRALLLEPEVLILDEITSMLDISVQAQILHILKQIQQEKELSFLFISHDAEVTGWFSDCILRLENGKILK